MAKNRKKFKPAKKRIKKKKVGFFPIVKAKLKEKIEGKFEEKKPIVKENLKKVFNREANLKTKIISLEKEKKQEIKPKIKIEKLKKKIKKKPSKEEKTEKKILEEYKLNVDEAVIDIKIEKGESGLLYNLYIPELGFGTIALLDDIRKELVSVSSIGIAELTDIKAISKMKKTFVEQTSRLLREKVPKISLAAEKFLSGMLVQEMLGLGKLEFLINDPGLEEIVVINSKEPVRVYHKKYGWLATNIKIEKEDEINNYANIIARRIGRQINILTPLLDAHIVTGDRANAVLYPIATKGNTITIRKFARDPWTIIDLIINKTASLEVAALLWLAIEYEMNVLISGGTASGKTVFLNTIMPFVPPNQRVISIEDTRELMLPEFLYWCPLVIRTPNPEGKGEVSMLDLLINSLRMRPDRIVLGEMRRQSEAEVLFEAMHTGHSVYATVHADTASETISRLTNPPLNVPDNLLKAVNLNVVMFRDRRKGIRRIYQVAEFVVEKEKVVPNILYRWTPEKDEIIKHNESMVFIEELSRHTAMSQEEINKSLDERKKILGWMIKKNIRSFEQIGKIMNVYYTNPRILSEMMKK